MLLQWNLWQYYHYHISIKTNLTSRVESFAINLIICVVCLKLSCYPKNCCDVSWPIEIQYIFFMLLAVQLALDGPVEFCLIVFCSTSDTYVCETFTTIMTYVPGLSLIICSGLIHFWVSASWTKCCPKCRSNTPASTTGNTNYAYATAI